MAGIENDPEQRLRDAFTATSSHADPAVVARARQLADGHRRRRDLGVAAGSGLAALALVGGLVIGPQLLGADRSGGGAIVAASTTTTDPATDAPSPDPTVTVDPSPSATLSFPEPAPIPSTTPSAIIPDWPTARPGSAATIPDSVLPTMAEMGSGLTTQGNRFNDSVGAAPLMGAQYCDAIDVSNMPGGHQVINPVKGAIMNAFKAPNGELAADITVNLFATGEGSSALDQLLTDRGFCRWYQVTPTLVEPAGGAPVGQTYWTFTDSARPGQLAGGMTRRGDVIVGVMTARATQAEALAEAKRLLTLTADRVVAQMPEATG